jgi:hypothetical protein
MNDFQKTLIGHALVVIVIALLAGFMLAFGLIGGLEVTPGQFVDVAIFGTTQGWARAHTGGVLNGLLMMAIAFALPHCDLTVQRQRLYARCMIFIGWANTIFYWFGNAAPNRALSFADNMLGATNIFGMIGYGVALIGGLLTLAILIHMARNLLRD